ncbi:hypothetical protein CRG98_014702 [Punica granatum]|uniref:Uncharacterized protein n=1 Tax=Punica granatum TaxID=22663 RepID=A0A2I0KAW4_PUNGR|nr:hypothetical protein CRG98_014702 [Punica granatum]
MHPKAPRWSSTPHARKTGEERKGPSTRLGAPTPASTPLARWLESNYLARGVEGHTRRVGAPIPSSSIF